MLFFLLILVFLSAASTVVNLALWERKRYALLAIGAIGAALFALTPVAIEVSLERLTMALSEYRIFSTLCALQVLEATLSLLSSTTLIRSHFGTRVRRLVAIAALLPGSLFLFGAASGLVVVVNQLHGYPFGLIGAGYALAIFAACSMIFALMRRALRSWDASLQARVLLAFLQLIFAMVAPLIIADVRMVASHLHFDIFQDAVAVGAMVLVAAAGLALNSFTRYRWFQ